MSNNNRVIQVRISQREKEIILNRMMADGYHNLSSWIRNKIISDSLWMEQKINAIYEKVCLKNESN